jgi:hypothetical protein
MESARRALSAAIEGDLRGLDAIMSELSAAGTREAGAWHIALDVAISRATPGHTPPSLERIAELPRDEGSILPIATACSMMCTVAAITMEARALEKGASMLAALAPTCPLPEVAVRAELAATWSGWLCSGDPAALVERARAVEAGAVRERIAPLVVEAASLRALVDLELGEIDSAVATARRASRMAAAEGLPQEQYLANLVLARVRRSAGHPHLASRILRSLFAVVPVHWHGWLRWERALATSVARREEDDVGRAREPGAAPASFVAADALERMLDATRAGDRERFDAAIDDTLAATRGCAPFEREVQDLALALDPRPSALEARPASELARRWRAGEVDAPPHGFHGVVAPRSADEPDTVGWVLADGASPRRVLRTGFLEPRERDPRGYVVLPPLQRKHSRIDAAAASIVLAGPSGIADGDLFHALYGFAYRPELHRATFDMLVHRVRERLTDVARLDREGGVVRAVPSVAIAVPDPRASPTLDDRLLQHLAAHGPTQAKAAADALGLPLRSVQRALGELVDGGALVRVKGGRKVEYALEDTTYSDPTRH